MDTKSSDINFVDGNQSCQSTMWHRLVWKTSSSWKQPTQQYDVKLLSAAIHSQCTDTPAVTMLITPCCSKTVSRSLHHWTGSKNLSVLSVLIILPILRSWKVIVDLLRSMLCTYVSELRTFPVIPSAQKTRLSAHMLGFMVYACICIEASYCLYI